MFNEQVLLKPIAVNGVPLDIVQEYVYLKQTLQLGRNNVEKEVHRRILTDYNMVTLFEL